MEGQEDGKRGGGAVKLGGCESNWGVGGVKASPKHTNRHTRAQWGVHADTHTHTYTHTRAMRGVAMHEHERAKERERKLLLTRRACLPLPGLGVFERESV